MHLDVPMSENVVSALAHLPCGLVIARMIGDDIRLLPEDHRMIAERLVVYWQTYKRPPGVHAIDLFKEITERASDPRRDGLLHILQSAQDIKDGINPDFIISRLSNYLRFEALSEAIIAMAKTLQDRQGDETSVAMVEEMMGTLLKARRVEFDPGLTLADTVSFLDRLEASKQGTYLRIKPLDEAGIMPQPGTLFVLIGVTGRGKTWFLVHVGACALDQQKKVCHISLEIDEADVIGRYYQRIFKASEYVASYKVTELSTDQNTGRITGMVEREERPDFTFRGEDRLVNPELPKELASRFEHLGSRVEDLRVKSWPPQKINTGHIEAYLDTMADVHHWEPDVLLIDYPRLFKFKSAETLRIELGNAVEDLRRIAKERNCAVVMVHQANRRGAEAKAVGLTHISEDWSVVQTADAVLSYSATVEEEKRGLGRLHVDKARSPRSKGLTTILTQSYDLGQFAQSAVAMPEGYLTYLDSQQAAVPMPVAEPEGIFDDDFEPAR